MRKSCIKAISCAALLVAIFVHSEGLSASANQYALADCQTVSNLELDAMRGGFVTASGLQFSMGITKAVLVGGVLQTFSELNIPNMAKPTSVSSAFVRNSDVSMLIQQGSQRVISHANGSTLVQNTGNGTLVQNSANQKVIQNITTLNMTTNSASMFRNLNIMTNIKHQFIDMLH